MRTETAYVGHVPSSPTGAPARTVAFSMLAATATTGLFWQSDLGINLSIFLTIGLAALLVWQRKPLTWLGWVTAASIFGLAWAFGYRASNWSALWSLSGLTLFVPAILLIARDRLSEPQGLFASVWDALRRQSDAIPESFVAPIAVFQGRSEGARRIGFGLFLGMPIALVFCMLFITADERFATVCSNVAHRVLTSNLFAISVVTISISGCYIWLARTLASREIPSDGTKVEHAFRHNGFSEPLNSPPLAHVTPTGLSPLTVGTTLGAIAMVFAAFVVVNIHDLFGGHARIREVQAMTYASHLHGGVTILCVTCLLAVGAVLAGHALVTRPTERPIGLRAVEVALLTLAGATLASCVTRLRIYAEAYGLSVLRLGIAALLIAVALVLLLTIVKSCMGVFRGYWAGQWVTFATFVTAGAWFDADGTVAQNQLQRAEAGKLNDLHYVMQLSNDACRVLNSPLARALKTDGTVDEMLKTRNEPFSDWRSRRGFACK